MNLSETEKRKDRILELQSYNEIDAFMLLDELANIIHEFSRDYLESVNLQNFTEYIEDFSISQNENDNLRKFIFLAEKGLVFLYQFNSLSLLILAGYRESADIFELQNKLDTIVNKLKV